MAIHVRTSLFAAAMVLLLASTSAAQDIPANGNTIRTDIVDNQGMPGERNVYVINNSSQNVFVTSIRLVECENIQGSCSTRRLKTRVAAGSRTLVHTVRPRSPDQGSSFRLYFTYEVEGAEAPDGNDLVKDKTALEIDTVIVKPKIIDVKVGETIDLSQILSLSAKNAAGKQFKSVYFNTRLILGDEFVTLEGSKITGKAVGTAAVSIAASVTMTPSPNPKGATQLVITVVE